MHLTSVTLRGFKSFADRTRLELHRGLVAVVGPNGAGKSNLIDALLWALGTQGPRALRAERMEDVIFTGTNHRSALGMAQVVLGFDNSRGAFPLEFSEVQVGRTLFRDGQSEYALNGASCRLLDIQELLSEAGIGREMHVVVAQGQVEDIVQARPEELRGYVEEAAGISKHRRRKERALRKIEHVETDIARAADLLGELRRQLRPLQAQVDRAQAHQEMSQRLRELRVRLAVADLEQLDRERERALHAQTSAGSELTRLRERLEELRREREAADSALAQVREQGTRLRGALERLRGAQSQAFRAVVVMRERVNARPDVRRREAAAGKLEALTAEEVAVRSALQELQQRVDERESAVVQLRATLSGVRGDLDGIGGRVEAVHSELASLDADSRTAEQAAVAARAEARAARERLERATERIGRLDHQMDAIRQDIERLDAEGLRAGSSVERFDAERREAQSAADEADRRLRDIESQAAVLAGRTESLTVARDLAASRRRSAEELKQSGESELDIRGILGDLVRVAPGLETAVEAVLGSAVDALVVAGSVLAKAVERAESEDRDVLLAATVAEPMSTMTIPGARPLSGAVEAPGFLRGTIDALLDGVHLVDDWQEAARLSSQYPHATFVTVGGRVLRARGLSRPAAAKRQGMLGIVAALERAQEERKRLDAERSRHATNRDRRRRELERLDGELEQARSVLHELEGRIAAAADRLREVGDDHRAASMEREVAERQQADRLSLAEQATIRREELEEQARRLRDEDAELSRRRGEAEGRAHALEAEITGLESGLTDLLTERASLTERIRGIEQTLAELRAELAQADKPPADPEDLVAAEAVLSGVEDLVAGVNDRVRQLIATEETTEAELRRIGAEASRAEVSIASLEPRQLSAAETLSRVDVRLEEIGSKLARELEIPPSRARQEFPPDADTDMLRAEEARLDAELRRLGPVNPLAAEEIVELEQRREFLEAQLEDLRRSKRDLMRLVRAAEERMRDMLVAAVQDADVRFREVAGLLFPEGDGRLRLVAEEDPLEGRLEIEVRLGRKGHRRLSFLSGGEKALAGLAFLFSLHLARPTPFLVLDEVDAPLDDANLGRFLRLLDSLRHQTQVLVVTHQKRTMERADALVGVTLGPDGTSRIVTERLTQQQLAAT